MYNRIAQVTTPVTAPLRARFIISFFIVATSIFSDHLDPSLNYFSTLWARRLIESNSRAAHFFIPHSGNGEAYSAPTAQELLISAYSYDNAGWDERAIKSYVDAMTLSGSPSAAKNWAAFWLGELIVTEGYHERLREVFSIRSPPWGKFWLAVWHFSIEDYDSAAALFSPLATGKSGHTIMWLMAGYMEGLSLNRMGATDSARSVFESLLERYPNSLLDGEINYRIGTIAFAQSDWEGCRTHLDSAMSFYDISVRKSAHWWIDEAAFLLGATDFMEERHILAMQQFERLQNEFPESPYVDRLPYLSLLGEIEALATQASQDSALLDGLSPDLSADLFLRIGYLFMQDGELSGAQDHFLRAAEVAEDRLIIGECYLFAGECAYRRWRYREATGYYQLASDAFGQATSNCEDRRREASWGLGWCFYRRRHYDDARLYFATVFSGHNDDLAERARLIYAKTFLAEGRAGRAASELRDFLITCRGRVCDNALYDLIVAYEALGDTDNVEESSWQFLTSYRRSRLAEDVVPKLANVLEVREKYSEIIKLADNVESYAISRETADRVRIMAERARYHLGVYDDPLQITEKFIEKYPDSPLVGELLIEIGSYLCEVGDYEKGAITFDRLRQRSVPDSLWAEATYRLGHCYLGMGDTLAASEIFAHLLGQFPMSPLAARGMIALGDYYMAQNLQERAVIAYNEVLENAKDPTQIAIAELRLAVTYENLGRYNEANVLYKGLLNKSGATVKVQHQALLRLVGIYYKMAEYERGYELAKGVYDTLATGQFRCELGEQMGRLAVRLGMVDQAMQLLLPTEPESLSCVGSEDQTILYDLSLSLEFRNRLEDAKKVWTWMIETSENDSIVAMVRRKLMKYESSPVEDNRNGP